MVEILEVIKCKFEDKDYVSKVSTYKVKFINKDN